MNAFTADNSAVIAGGTDGPGLAAGRYFACNENQADQRS